MTKNIERLQPELLQAGNKEIWLAGGCFWGTEEYLANISGVVATSVGYANGHTEHPTYEEVCAQDTGFAETVQVIYDPLILPLEYLLQLFFRSIDPTSLNRQGNDVGSQYRTGIYYLHEADLPVSNKALQKLAKQYDTPLAIELAPLRNYYLAEDYHQRYLQKNPGGYCHIPRRMFAEVKEAHAYQKPQDEALKLRLTPLQYEVTQQNATEPPFQNEYYDHFEPGVYLDITTGEPLFLSLAKFESGCGWPAFAKPLKPELIRELTDSSHGMVRTEVRSTHGDAHLGHVFPDGPPELGGLRYCINSAALSFVPKNKMAAAGLDYLLPLLEEEKE